MNEIKVLLTILASIIVTISAQEQPLKHVPKPKRSLSVNPIFTSVFQNANPSTSFAQKFFEGTRDHDTIIWKNVETNSRNVPQNEDISKPTPWISQSTNKFIYGLPKTENLIPFGGYELKKDYDVPTFATIQRNHPNTADLTPIRKTILSKFELPEVTLSTSFVKTISVPKERHEYPNNNENQHFKYGLPTIKVADSFSKFESKGTYELPKHNQYAAPSKEDNKVSSPYDSTSSTQLHSSLHHSIKIPAITYVQPQGPPKITVSDHWIENNPTETSYGIPKRNLNLASTQHVLANSKLYHAFIKHTTSYNPNITLTPVNVLPQNFVEVPYAPGSPQATADALRNNQVPEFFIEYKPRAGRPKKHIEIATFQAEGGVSVSIPLNPEKKIEEKHEEYGVPKLELPIQKRAKRSPISFVPEHFNLIPDSYWNRYNEIAKDDNDGHELESPDNNYGPSKDATPIENNEVKVTRFSIPHKNYIVTVTRTDRTDPPHKNNKHSKTDSSDSSNKNKIIFYVNGVRQNISPDSFMRKNNKLYSDITDVFSSNPSTSVENINFNGQNYKLFQETSHHNVARASHRKAKRSISFNPIFSSVFHNADPSKHLVNKFFEGASRDDLNSWNTKHYAPNNPYHTSKIHIPYWSRKVKNCKQPFKEYGLPKPLDSYGVPYLKTSEPVANYGPPKFVVSKPFKEYGVPKSPVSKPHEFYEIYYPATNKPAINYGPPKFVVSEPFKEYSVPKAPGSKLNEFHGISYPETNNLVVNYGPPKFGISKPFQEYAVPKARVPEPYKLYGIPSPEASTPAVNYGRPKFVVSEPFTEYTNPRPFVVKPYKFKEIPYPETKPAINYGPPKFEISKPFQEYAVPKVSVSETHEFYEIPYPEGNLLPAVKYGPPKFVVSEPFTEYSMPKPSVIKPYKFKEIPYPETKPVINYGPPKIEVSKPFQKYDVPKAPLPNPHEIYRAPNLKTDKSKVPRAQVSVPFTSNTFSNQVSYRTQTPPFTLPKFGKSHLFNQYTTQKLSSTFHHTGQIPIINVDQSLDKNKLPKLAKIGNEKNLPKSNIPIFQNNGNGLSNTNHQTNEASAGHTPLYKQKLEPFIYGLPTTNVRYSFQPSKDYILHAKNPPTKQEKHLPNVFSTKPFNIITQEAGHGFIATKPILSNTFHEVTVKQPVTFVVPHGGPTSTYNFHVEKIAKEQRPTFIPSLPYKLPKNEKPSSFQYHDSQLHGPQVTFSHFFGKDNILTTPKINRANFFSPDYNVPNTKITQHSFTSPIVKPSEYFQGFVSKPIASHAFFPTPQTPPVFVEVTKPTKQDSIPNILPKLPNLHTSPSLYGFRLPNQNMYPSFYQYPVPSAPMTYNVPKTVQNIPQQHFNKPMATPIETHSPKKYMYAPIYQHTEHNYVPQHPQVLVPNDLPTALKENIEYNSKFSGKYLYKQNAGSRKFHNRIQNRPVSSETVEINSDVKDIVASFLRNRTNKIENSNIEINPNSPSQKSIVPKLPTEKSSAYVNEHLIKNNNLESDFLKSPKFPTNNKFYAVKHNIIPNNDLSSDVKGVLMPKLFKKHPFSSQTDNALLPKVDSPKFGKTSLKNDSIMQPPLKDIIASFFKKKDRIISTLINGSTGIAATKLPDGYNRPQIFNRSTIVSTPNRNITPNSVYRGKPDVTPEVINNSLHTTEEFTESTRSDIPVEHDSIPSNQLTQKDIGLTNKTYNRGIYRHPNFRYLSSNEMDTNLHARKNVAQLHNSTSPNPFITSNHTQILKSSKLQNYENNESVSTNSAISVENGNVSVNSDSSVDKNIVSYDNTLEDPKKRKVLLKVVKRPMYSKNNVVNKDRVYEKSDETIVYERYPIK